MSLSLLVLLELSTMKSILMWKLVGYFQL